jgi:hypothetical protein
VARGHAVKCQEIPDSYCQDMVDSSVSGIGWRERAGG